MEKSKQTYEEALAIDKGKIASLLAAPSLFDWFIGANSVITGAALFLYSRIVEDFTSGRFGNWITPIQAALVLGGIGLVLSGLSPKVGAAWKTVFRLVLAASYGCLALIWWGGAKFDGAFIGVWFSLVTILTIVADLTPLRSYLIFYQGLLIGLAVILFNYPQNSLVSGWLSVVVFDSGLNPLLAFAILFIYVAASWWGYVRNKRVAAILVGAVSVPLGLLAFIYANQSAWLSAFILLMTAVFAFLLPPWDEVRFRLTKQRRIAARMFSVLLALFLLTILLIRVLQGILISNTFSFLSDKVTYGRILMDSTITNATGAVRSLGQNPVFAQALFSRREAELSDFSKTFFENNRSLSLLVVADVRGRIVSAYPLTPGLSGRDISREDYFAKAVVAEMALVSDVLSAALELSVPTMAVSSPVIRNGQVIGVLVGFLNLQSLSDSLMEVATPASGEYFVVMDKVGNWIVGPADLAGRPADLAGRPTETATRAGDPLVNILMQRGSLSQGYAADGILTLSARDTTRSTNFPILIAQPLFAALSVNQTAYLIVLALASLSVIVVGLSILAEREVEKGYGK